MVLKPLKRKALFRPDNSLLPGAYALYNKK